MSALASSHPLSTRPSILGELEASLEISRLASAARRYHDALEAIFAVVVAVPGVWRITTEVPPDVGHWLTLDRIGKRPKLQWSSAIAPLDAGLHRWGQLRLCFELSSEISNSPVRFTKYVAQQIAALLDRTALRDQTEVLRQQISALSRRLEVRKAVARAVGLVARRDRVSHERALAQVTALARHHRRSLLLTAQSIVFLESEGGSLRRPTLRRHLQGGTTSSPFQANRRRARP